MKSKKSIKKPVLISLIVLVSVGVLFCIFFVVGGNFLKIDFEETDKEISFNDENFQYPLVKCTFFGSDVSNNVERLNDIDISKLGEQNIEYTCKKLFFSKKASIKYVVVDKTNPEITLNGNPELSVYLGGSYEEKGATAKDNFDGDLSDKISIEGTVDVNTVGDYNIKYVVKDSSGNTSEVERKVHIKEKPSPSSCGDAGVIYLTFDDGPNTIYTPVILDVLKKYDVKATFFITSAGTDELVKREFDEGHAIGIHSATHAYDKIYVSSEAFWSDMNIVKERIEKVTGKSTDLMRFPGGASNTVSRKYNRGIMTQLAKEIEEKGYGYFDWNISSGDAGGTTDPEVEYNNVISSLSKSRGNVILMHDIKKHTSLAIENIVKYGLDHGYKFDVLNKDIICHQRINN